MFCSETLVAFFLVFDYIFRIKSSLSFLHAMTSRSPTRPHESDRVAAFMLEEYAHDGCLIFSAGSTSFLPISIPFVQYSSGRSTRYILLKVIEFVLFRVVRIISGRKSINDGHVYALSS